MSCNITSNTTQCTFLSTKIMTSYQVYQLFVGYFNSAEGPLADVTWTIFVVLEGDSYGNPAVNVSRSPADASANPLSHTRRHASPITADMSKAPDFLLITTGCTPHANVSCRATLISSQMATMGTFGRVLDTRKAVAPPDVKVTMALDLEISATW
jgi:hypothetical protein